MAKKITALLSAACVIRSIILAGEFNRGNVSFFKCLILVGVYSVLAFAMQSVSKKCAK